MKIKRLLVLISMFIIFSTLFSCQNENQTKGELTLYKETVVKNMLGLPTDGNGLKLFDVCLNNQTNRAYVHSILTSYIAEIDVKNAKLIKYLNSNLGGYHISYLACDETNNLLYIVDQSSKTITQMDLESAKIKKTVSLTDKPTKIGMNQASGHIAVSYSAKNKLDIFKIPELTLIKTLDVDNQVFGPMGIWGNGNEFYIVQGRDRLDPYNESGASTYSSLLVLSLNDWSTDLISVPYKGSDEGALDVDANHFYLISSDRLRKANLDKSENSISVSIKGPENTMIFQNQLSDQLMVLTRDGLSTDALGSPYGSLELYGKNDLKKAGQIQLGMKPARGVLAKDGKTFIAPSMAEGIVSILDLSTMTTKSVDVASSIEGISISNDDQKMYAISRLGGSFLHILSSQGQLQKTVALAPWPVQIISNKKNNQAVILSHFHSVIELFDYNTDQKVGEIDLKKNGVTRNVTHYLSRMVLNETNQLLYIAFPEQGKIVEVDLASGTMTKSKQLFTAITSENEEDQSYQVGYAQLAVAGENGELFVYLRNESKLLVVNPAQDFALITEKQFSLSDFSSNSFGGDLLHFDTDSKLLFVGNKVFEWNGVSLSEKSTLSSTEKYFGKKDNLIFTVKANGDEQFQIQAWENNQGSFQNVLSQVVNLESTLSPNFIVQNTKQRISIGLHESTKLLIYDYKVGE